MKQKNRNKPIMCFTIDKNIILQFNNISKQLSINKSLLIENLIKGWLNENSIQKKLPDM